MNLKSPALYLILRLLNATLRVRHLRPHHIDETPRYIIAFWHECILGAMHSRWRKPTVAMISRSRDGELVSGVVDRYGIDIARGSTNKGGGIALREMVRHVRDGKSLAFTPDGPKGPRRELKEGVVVAAKMTGLPIVPFHFTARWKTRARRSWDQMILPAPFSEAVFVYGEPIVVPRDGDLKEWRLKVEKAMNDLADEAEAEVKR